MNTGKKSVYPGWSVIKLIGNFAIEQHSVLLDELILDNPLSSEMVTDDVSSYCVMPMKGAAGDFSIVQETFVSISARLLIELLVNLMNSDEFRPEG